MQKVDLNSRARKEVFDFFSGLSQPFYYLTFRQDVTDLYRFAKEKHLSFYYALVYLCTKAMDSVEAFRYMLQDGELYLLDQRIPSFRDLKPGSETFHIVTLPCGDDIEMFCRTAREMSTSQTAFRNWTGSVNDHIFFSCVPWVELTAVSNDRDFHPDDTIPRIAWGKYTEENGRKMLNIGLELNHRFIDGIHIGKFAETLTRMMAEL